MLCHACHRTFFEIDISTKRKHDMRTRYEVFRSIANTHYTLRTLAKVVGISLGTAFTWRHRHMDELQKRHTTDKCFDSGGGVVKTTSVYLGKTPDRYFYSSYTRNYPQMACFSIHSTKQGILLSTILHPAGFIRPVPALAIPDYLAKSTLEHMLIDLSSPGACIKTPFGLGTVLGKGDEQNADTPQVYWHPRGPRVAPGTHWRIACKDVKAVDHIYEQQATKARIRFLCFMHSFRGIAAANVGKYVSWFNACAVQG